MIQLVHRSTMFRSTIKIPDVPTLMRTSEPKISLLNRRNWLKLLGLNDRFVAVFTPDWSKEKTLNTGGEDVTDIEYSRWKVGTFQPTCQWVLTVWRSLGFPSRMSKDFSQIAFFTIAPGSEWSYSACASSTRNHHRTPGVPGLKESFRWELKQVRRIPRMDH